MALPETLLPALGSQYPSRPRIIYLLSKRHEASAEAFAAAVGAWRRAQSFGVEAGAVIARAGVAIAERDDVAARFGPAGSEVTGIDGYVSLELESYAASEADFDALFAAVQGCLDPLDAVVDRAASIALAGVGLLPIPGYAPLSMILVLDRPAGMTHLQYNTWWVHHGFDHRRGFPAQAGYHQLHNDPAFNARAAQAAGTTTTDMCITDIMYLGDLGDAFASVIDRNSEDGRAVSADIGAHVSVTKVLGSLFQEV
ncbi:hypothetical protein [Sphingobium sp.]|uniref:hypothetical protein n=1 Tax=Sphingobium sp. TaxID=1912891 RepID=UPI003BB66C48